MLELVLAGHHRDVVDGVHSRAGSDSHCRVCNFQSVSDLETEDRENKNVISVLVKNKQIMIIMEMQKLQDNYTKINIWRNHWRIQKATNKLNIDELCTQIKP